MNDTKTLSTVDRLIAIGGSIKALGDNRFGGYLVRFYEPSERDLHGEWFSAKTDFCFDDYPVVGAPVLFQHGFDPVIGIKRLGVFTAAKIDDYGVWAEGIYDERKEYIDYVRQMVADGVLDFSSGAWPQSVVVDEKTNHIDRWAIMEGSKTHTPADWRSAMGATGTRIQPLKALMQALEPKEGEPKEVAQQDVKSDVEHLLSKFKTTIHEVKNMTPEQIMQLITSLCQMLVGEMPGTTPTEEAAASAAMQEQAKVDGALPQEELMKSLVNAGVKAINDLRDKQRAIVKSALAAAKSEPGIGSVKTDLGGASLNPSTPDAPAARGGGNISVGEDLKYAHLTAEDMAMAWKLAVASRAQFISPMGMGAHKATDFVPEAFYRHAMQKMYLQVERTKFSRAEDAAFVKHHRPTKADELNASDITGQGLEWLGTVYDTMVWETARNNQIYKLMMGRGMMEKQVPNGMKSVEVPIEGDDPTVYGGVEANSVDATGRPEMVYKITPQTTATVTVTPGTFRTATSYTFTLDEDGFVDMASEANRKVRLALEEHIEKAMINADSATAANTNINKITGTPVSAGLTKDYYLEFDGLRKSPLVTSTAYSRSGGTLDIQSYRRTWKLLGSNIAPRKQNIFFLIDFDTFQASLDLLPGLTKEVAGDRAALFTGEFEDLWGIPVYMSGFLALSNTAGKIDTVTTANNTKGQILAVYAPYWAFVFKRNINIEMQRSPSSESYEFYGSMRFSLQRRSAAAAAISYNLTV